MPLLPFPPGATLARLIRREKRFIIEAETSAGPILAHSNNSGSMLGLIRPGALVLLSRSANPGRRLPYTLELIEHQGFWVGVNTLTPNRLLAAAWRQGLLPELAGYATLKPEATHGASRIDCLLTGPAGPLYVEAKNVTLVEDDIALFPDSPTERGRKHLQELTALARQGTRTAVFFLIQRPDARCFAPADIIDPDFARLFYDALDAGVEAWPYTATVTTAGIDLGRRLPVVPHGLNVV